MLHSSIRILSFVLGLLFFLGGLAMLSTHSPEAPTGLWGIVIGTAAMVTSVLQRTRYRSIAAERSNAEPGPGGGEVGYMEPRFAPTTEVFTDPTSHCLMRVYMDPRTGERRYRAEG
jgi:hypothetical protein